MCDVEEHRFQIFNKKLGVKFYDRFLLSERLQRNLNYITVNLPLDFSEVFNIFRITVVFFFFKNSRKFSKKKLKTIVISKPVDERSNNFQEYHRL